MFTIGSGATWKGGSFYKPVEEIRDDGKAYATKFDVCFGGGFSGLDLKAAADEVAAWDGATAGKYIQMADWAKTA